jgi:hypothetical protein
MKKVKATSKKANEAEIQNLVYQTGKELMQ